ncbi:unnamed protein product [Cladocopium goreaui]|uniref:Spindle pole body component n=1 Tax=Cladocopium goreaui TaxID=2562237 RepID=A0A9P1CJB4_9DINO|nr:unnamed protein product [Cladocopium goreaui]
MTFSHGAKYQGQWREGRCHGRGTQWKGDYRYEGDFKDGKRHGQGSLYYHGRVFVGGWSASKMALSEVGNVLHQKNTAPMTCHGW